MTISKHGSILNVEKIRIQMRMIAQSGVHEILMLTTFDKTASAPTNIYSQRIALLDLAISTF